MDVEKIIRDSFDTALRKTLKASPPITCNKERSAIWVEALASSFKEIYQGKDDKVFSKGCDDNKEEFNLNELLHDITVCQVNKVPAAVHKTDLSYVQTVFWQVESEMAKDSHQAVIDFSKLVLGSAQNKLFVGPLVFEKENDGRSAREPYREALLSPARACQGNVYLALIPHPADWGNDCPCKIEVYVLEHGKWQAI